MPSDAVAFRFLSGTQFPDDHRAPEGRSRSEGGAAASGSSPSLLMRKAIRPSSSLSHPEWTRTRRKHAPNRNESHLTQRPRDLWTHASGRFRANKAGYSSAPTCT
jgi:hypothetical protein